ncbi:shikimate/quinate 5-dehydrogenase [Aspergillus sclerotiicarbonarius CBS 121057]|uniref:Shikimate/quinate 5-dehydrogenase n=1 Tax=Aspergillus sclerotiicarbonarius (strain CBS 121057 / IBT 28362) TaxID=1448318 RepID=A0A319EL13_ASPSB|nr:shikimate/quinate 5-dehydrogenase [Aspergillus sclerotiicarbonarius CBS 121057]
MHYLNNTTIHDLLLNLTGTEALNFLHIIETTLCDFSTGNERHHQASPSTTTRPTGQRTLFRPFTSDSSVGCKIIVESPPTQYGKKEPLHGIIVILDAHGHPTGLLAAEEVTGFRTSMNAMVPFCWRKHVESIVIFGAGVQALWHTRLILMLRGDEVKRITFVNGCQERVKGLIETVRRENEVRWRSACVFGFIISSAEDAREQIKDCLAKVDCVFCTTPSRTPLFPADYLTEREESWQPFVSAVGSWQADMIELDPGLLRYAVGVQGGYNPVTGEDRGVVLVDDRDYALENAGEVVQSGLGAEEMVELGKVISLKGGTVPAVSDRQVEKTDRFISEGIKFLNVTP